jgi:glucose/arabinose dehydrogenase
MRGSGFIILLGLTSATCQPTQTAGDLDYIRLPEGFSISVYADNIENARSMCWGDSGTLFVGTRSAGNVYAVVDTNQDYVADRTFTLARGLNMPNGVAFHAGSLYVAEVSRILRFDDIENRLHNPPDPEVVFDGFPDEQHHGWKFIRIGPDGRLYVPVGAPCNVCEREDSIFSTITSINLDGTDLEVYAHGVRNTVGFDWHPHTGELWFTDNGRDLMGDDMPPDELNRARRKGQHFGFPYCHGNAIADPEFGAGHECERYEAPMQALGPHVAALGMRFNRSSSFPAAYRNMIFIAEHGSWNRTFPIGYRVTMVELNERHEAVRYEPFAEGWLQGRTRHGRPVDIEFLPDGSMLISDDMGNRIYRVRYGE